MGGVNVSMSSSQFFSKEVSFQEVLTKMKGENKADAYSIKIAEQLFLVINC